MFKRTMVASISLLVLAIIASTAVIVGHGDCDCSEEWDEGYMEGVEAGMEMANDQYTELLEILEGVLDEKVE